MRLCHWIKPNARNESPSRAIWFKAWTYTSKKTKHDTTYGFEVIRLCRGVKDVKTGMWSWQWCTVKTAAAFWNVIDFLTVDKTRTYLLCDDPNMHLALIQAFSETCSQGWTLTLAVLPPAPTICRWRKGNKSVVLLGASNIWPTPLAGCSTGKTACTHLSNNGADEPCTHVKLLDRVISALRDRTTEWWTFLRENGLGGFSPTAGAQSFRVWRHKYMTHRVLIDCHDDALALARKAIYGARCEIFRDVRTTGTLYELDANGSYGGVMRDMRVPVKLESYRTHFTIEDLREWIQDFVCVARVDLDCSEPVFPMHDNHRLCFCAGRFTAVLAGEELHYAMEHGLVIGVHEASMYEYAPAFSQYMQALWSLRKISESLNNLGDADKYKLLMASFFGRWAQHGRVWEKVRDAEDDTILSWIDINADSGEIVEWRQFGGIVQKLNNDGESRESHPAIAACILAGGRQQLWRWMQRAGMDHIRYCDTDALFTDAVGVERLRDDIKPHELGKLKVKGIYSSVTFYGQKHIVVDGHSRHSGVPTVQEDTDSGMRVSTSNQYASQWIRIGESPRASTRQTVRKDQDETKGE